MILKKIKKPKLNDLKIARKLEEKYWKVIVKQRAGNKCELEGCERSAPEYQMHAHHIECKPTMYLRLHLDNGICLCAWHHMAIHGQHGLTEQKITQKKIEKVKGTLTIAFLEGLKYNSPSLKGQMDAKQEDLEWEFNQLNLNNKI